jgi:hypothetical protein
VPNSAELRGELARLGGSKSIPGAKVVLAKSMAGSQAAQSVSVNYNPAIQAQPGRARRRGASTFIGQHRARHAMAGGVSARLRHSASAYATQLASSN